MTKATRVALLVTLGVAILISIAWAANVGEDVSRLYSTLRMLNTLEVQGRTPEISWETEPASPTGIALDHNMGLSGGLGKFPISQEWPIVQPGDTSTSYDDYHSWVAIPTSSDTTIIVDTGITQPDYPRSVVTYASVASAIGAVVTVYGTNQYGVSISEALTIAAATTAVETDRVFKTISRFTIRGVDGGSGSVALGAGAKFGLARPIAAASDVKQVATKNSAGTSYTVNTSGQLPAGCTVDPTYDTVLPHTTPINAGEGFKISYETPIW